MANRLDLNLNVPPTFLGVGLLVKQAEHRGAYASFYGVLFEGTVEQRRTT